MMDFPDISDLVPELICLSVDALLCGILYKVYTDTNSAIEAVKKAPSLDLETAKNVSQFILENGFDFVLQEAVSIRNHCLFRSKHACQ